jgi:hypothetical protein
VLFLAVLGCCICKTVYIKAAVFSVFAANIHTLRCAKMHDLCIIIHKIARFVHNYTLRIRGIKRPKRQKRHKEKQKKNLIYFPGYGTIRLLNWPSLVVAGWGGSIWPMF